MKAGELQVQKKTPDQQEVGKIIMVEQNKQTLLHSLY